jgi:hypothetical protein
MAENQLPKQVRKETSMPHPVVQIKQEFKTKEVQHIFTRTYRATDAALLWLDIIVDKVSQQSMEFGGNEEVMFHKVMEMIEDRIDNCITKMNKDLERLIGLRESSGVNLDVCHKNTLIADVEVNSPITVKFLNIFVKFDEVLEEMYILHFGSVLNRNQRNEIINRLSKEVQTISRIIIDSNSKAQDLNRKAKRAKTNIASSKNETNQPEDEDIVLNGEAEKNIEIDTASAA